MHTYQKSLLDFVIGRRVLLEITLEIGHLVRKLLVESAQEAEQRVLLHLHRIFIEKFKTTLINRTFDVHSIVINKVL